MKKEVTYRTLENFSKGKYSWNDYLQVRDWFSNIHDFKEVKTFLYEQWKGLNKKGIPDDNSLKHIYEQIEYHILLEERQELKRKGLWSFYRQAAAILLIPVLAFSLWHFLMNKQAGNMNLAWVEINSPPGARTQFLLPDGSVGWLNSGSTLKYNPVFSNKREVELSGEAYFEVVPDNSVFTVNAADLNVRVLGTKFNVSAYPDDDFTEVVLASGKVAVEGEDKFFEKILLPNEKLTFLPGENKYTVKQVDTNSYVAWKDGFLLLDNEPLEEAINRIERWYNVVIEVEDETLKRYRFKATFQDEPLEEVLKLLAVSTPMEYTFEKRVVDDKNFYQKKKVTIKLKQ
ncbi:FecR family protein [Mariniphaga sediminis]|uniref:FecR family protein n=1 Tax=Mariniphaga sediminis TaxID=1628158 RepID=UPI003564AE2B